VASRPADPPAGLAGAAFLSAAGLVVVVMACSLVGPRGVAVCGEQHPAEDRARSSELQARADVH